MYSVNPFAQNSAPFGYGNGQVFDVRAAYAPVQQKQYLNALQAIADGASYRESGIPQTVVNNALAGNGGPTNAAAREVEAYAANPQPVEDWLRYTNQNATRNDPLSQRLTDDLSFLGPMGVTMEVFSGGQAAKGSGEARVGSTRHDHGNAADVFFYQNGRRLSWENPQDIPILQTIVSRAKANGLTGFGAGPGYMRPGSMHLGYGTPAVWGDNGRSANAPAWLREAYAANPGTNFTNDALASAGL